LRDSDVNDSLPAGNFSLWLEAMRRALSGREGMDVACGDCVGCCTSSYYIKVRARERDALAAIPARHLEPDPAAPGGMLMGYDAAGHCPMFGAAGCSIYPNRPETCRTYDCRVFAAAGMTAGEQRPAINARIARWRFDYPGADDQRAQRAVRAAAGFLRQHPVRFPGGYVPSRPAEIAVIAVKSYTVFLEEEMSDRDRAAAIVRATLAFDASAEAVR
jgi:Fe-S-cluster containining protein